MAPQNPASGAAEKAEVVVAVETLESKPRFAAMQVVPRVSAAEIQFLVQERLSAEVVVRTDGWQGYSVLDNQPGRHVWVVPTSGPEAVKLLPWLHTLIANVKGNIPGVHHGVSQKPLSRYLAEFC